MKSPFRIERSEKSWEWVLLILENEKEEGKLVLWRTASLATYSSNTAAEISQNHNGSQYKINDSTPLDDLNVAAPVLPRDLKYKLKKVALPIFELQANGNSEALWRPLWEYSKELALDRITRGDAAEFHSFHSPYPAIEMVACAASSLLSNRRIQEWRAAKSHFTIENIRASLQNFQLENVSFPVVLHVATYARNPRFRPTELGLINGCASKFCDWTLSILQAFAWRNAFAFRNYSEVFRLLSTLKPEFNRKTQKPNLESNDEVLDHQVKKAPRKTYVRSRTEIRLHSLLPRALDRSQGIFSCKDGDLFDTMESMKAYFLSFLEAQDGVGMLLFNLPGQANTSYPSQSTSTATSPSKSVLSNLWLASRVNELLEDLRILTSTRSFHVIGFGNGGNVASAWSALYGARIKYREAFRSLVLCNPFAKVDDCLTSILHDCIKKFSCFPSSHPELPSAYLQKLLYSTPFLARVESKIDRWVDPECWNNITLDGRIQICKGALCHTDLTPHLQSLCHDALVRSENAETFLQFRQRVVHLRQTQFREDIASLRISEKMSELWRDGEAGALAVWLEAGHEARYEAKDALITVLTTLVHFEGGQSRKDLGGNAKAQENEKVWDGIQTDGERSGEVMESCLDKLRREQVMRRHEWERSFTLSIPRSLTDTEPVSFKDTIAIVPARENLSFPTFARLRTLPVARIQKEPSKYDILGLGRVHKIELLSQCPRTEKKTQAEYAICIQRYTRGYVGRKRMVRVRASRRITRFARRLLLVKRWKYTVECLFFENEKRRVAAGKLQSFWRRRSTHRLYQQKRQKPSKYDILGLDRVHKNELLSQCPRREKKTQAEYAICIQRYTREYVGRKRMARVRASRRITRFARIFLLVKRWKYIVECLFLENEKRRVAAGKLQSLWRRRSTHRLYQQKRQSASSIMIQRVSRGYRCRVKVAARREQRDKNRQKQLSAIKFQSIFWRMFVYQKTHRKWRYTFQAARTIQKVYRGHLGRRQVAQKQRWNAASHGQERLELGLEMIESSKKAFDKQKSELDELHRAQQITEVQMNALQTELRASELDISALTAEIQSLVEPKVSTQMDSRTETSIAWERKKKNLELELSSVWELVEEKRATLTEMEGKLAEMEVVRQRKDREFTRLQRNLMELLNEQKLELENLREKGIELENATATSAAAAAITATKAKENEFRSREMFESTEELLKFQFMSMSLSYFSSINMLKNLREMNSDTTNAALSSTAESAAAASAAAMAANLKPFSHLSPGRTALVECQNPSDAPYSRESQRVTLPTNVFDWTIQHVGVWLDTLSLSQYKGAFLEAAVDGEFLLELRPEDLSENLGVCHKLHVQKILIARKKLLSHTAAANSENDRIDLKATHSDNTQENVFSQARNGRVELIEQSLKAGFPINKRDDKGNTLLIVACQNANRSLVEFLLNQKADINTQNLQGNTALHYAFAYDTTGVLAEYMIGQGADDTIENVFGLSPYDGPSI
ncbi:hypothetical protein ABG067_003398 [Albugo candida]